MIKSRKKDMEMDEKENIKGDMKKDMDIDKRSLLFFMGMLVVGGMAIIAYLVLTGNTPQIFYDVVNEYTAKIGSNKSAERALFYIFSLLGIVAYTFFYFRIQKKMAGSGINNPAETKEDKSCLYVILGVLIFTAVYCFVYSGVDCLLIAGLMMVIILFTIDKALVIPGMAYYFVSVYAICALYRIYVFAGGQKTLSLMSIVLIVILSSLVLLVIDKENRTRSFLRGILLAQMIVPFSMLTYLASSYQYGEEYISIQIPYRVHILIWVMIITFVIEAFFKLHRKWNSATNVGEIITYGVCIAIMSFNRYSGSGSVISMDLHHPFENIIGFSQIFELGQKAFSEYIPTAGMYSVVHGFFLSFFGQGKVSFYYLTTNIFFLVAIVLIVVLLKQQLKGEWVLLISLIFLVDDYDRITLIVPIMLLLTWPKLIEKKNLWLKVWFLSSFLHGLYYPVFGAAVCVGFLPLGIWQIVTYVKSGELKKDIKKVSFWIYWIVCCIPVGLGFGVLLGTVKHMKAMGSQTVYADGITRFGQVIPDDFFSYIQSLPVRLIVYYLFSFLIVIGLVWLSIALCLRIGNVRIENRHVKMDNPVPAYLSLAFGIALLVAFTYTVVRMDIGSVYARTAGVVYAAFVMLIIIVSRYMKGMKNRFWIYGIAIFSIAAVTAEGFGFIEYNSKLSPAYSVPENYVYVNNDKIERLGECFVEQGVYDSIENAYDYAADMDRDASYLGLFEDFGFYYLCNLKGDSVIEIAPTVKGYDAVQETIDLIRKNGTIVGSSMSSVSNYYFYYWLVNSGEYVWDSENRVFVPNDGSVTLEDIQLQNKYIDVASEGASLGRTAGSWGKSMDTLYDIFSRPEIEPIVEDFGTYVSVDFQQDVSGNDADFMYIEFADQDQNYQYTLFNLRDNVLQDVDEYQYIKGLMKKDYNRDIIVVVFWTDEAGAVHSMDCRMDQGKLLIPLGGGQGWLLNEHANITIAVAKGEEIMDVPEITNVEMLKLREVK
ncbi:MAG: hypothetical protein ACI4AA_04530 [Lachnospiraceae bacterium]